MSQFSTWPCTDNACCSVPGSPAAQPPSNPQLSYNSATQTNPTAANIVPPYLNLPATCYDILGIGSTYTWNYASQKWV